MSEAPLRAVSWRWTNWRLAATALITACGDGRVRVHTTCRLQRRALHDYLADALTAHERGDPIPLLA